MLILTLSIHITGMYDVSADTGSARMILFDGTASGDLFQGTILPGGVDTQLGQPDGSGSLSARYMLEGTDKAGEKCRIFIQNNAAFGAEETQPRIITDSAVLSFLNTAPLKGRIIAGPDSLTILIETAD